MKVWIQEQVYGPIRELKKAWGKERSSSWRQVRNEHIEDYPQCHVCSTTKGLHVHHIVPFHVDPSKELMPANLITLCRRDHFLFGHLLDWKSWNENVAEQTYRMWLRIRNRPYKEDY